MSLKLNLGAGDFHLPGYESIDVKYGKKVYPLDDYEDGSVDEIYASHVLEHFSHNEVGIVLKHWVSKLGPGGCIRISVPDFLRLAKDYVAGVPFNIQGWTMGGQVDQYDYHGAIFDEEALTELFYECGLERIQRFESEFRDTSNNPQSLNLMAFKPHANPEKTIGQAVRLSLGAPRFAPTMHFRCTIAALTKLNIPYTCIQGCFWHQNISRTMQQDLEQNPKYIMTADYDSIFTPEDIVELYRLMEAYPSADAIFATQSKRIAEHALFSIKNPDGTMKKEARGADFMRNLTKVYSGHFGLTIFRTESLKKMSKPWMNDHPNPQGEWEEGKLDADVSFWEKWMNEGFSAYLANNVVIGHMEEMITWPGPDFKPIHQFLNDYVVNGKPKGIKFVNQG